MHIQLLESIICWYDPDPIAKLIFVFAAASADSTAIAAQIAQAADCSMSIQLQRRLTDLNHTDSTLHALATKSGEKSGLA